MACRIINAFFLDFRYVLETTST